jgi:hypothetical protein
MGGGLLPVMGRLDFGWRLGRDGMPARAVIRCKRRPSDYLAALYVDTIRWSTTPFEIKALIDSSPRFKAHKSILEENRVTFGPASGPGNFFQHPILWSMTVPLPFITRENNVFIPLDVWENAALFFIATLSDELNPRSAPPRVFRVKVVAVNAKPPGVTTPEFLANIEISVTNSND